MKAAFTLYLQGKEKKLLSFLRIFSFFWAVLPFIISCGGGGGEGGGTPAPSPPGSDTTYRVYGLNFSPYLEGQDPNLGSEVSEQQLRARMAIIAPHTEWIRTFGCTKGWLFTYTYPDGGRNLPGRIP